MATDVEIVLRARNEAAAALNGAARQLSGLQAAGARTGASLKASFSDATSAVGRLVPEVGRLSSAVGSIQTVTASGVGLVAGAIAAIGAAVAGGVVAAQKFSSEVERLDNLAAATGASIENLQVLAETFRRAGLGAEAADASLIRFNKAIAEQNPLLKQLGIDARDPVQALLQLSQAFRSSNNEAAKTKVAFELMGRGSADVLKIIDGLVEQFPELRAEMVATGQVFSKDAVEAGRAFDKEWDRFTGRWEGFMARIGGTAAQAGNAIIDAFTKPSNAAEATERQARAIENSIGFLRKRIEEEREALGRSVGSFGLAELFFGNASARQSEGEAQIRSMTEQLKRLELQLQALRGETGLFSAHGLAEGAEDSAKSVDLVAAAVDGMGKKAKEAKRSLAELLSDMQHNIRSIPGGDELLKSDRRGLDQPGDVTPGKVDVPDLAFTEAADETLDAIDALDRWNAAITEMANVTQAAVAIQQAAFSGMLGVFTTFTDGLVDGANLMKIRVVDEFKEMVKQVLRELLKLAAAKLFKFLISVATGNPAAVFLDAPLPSIGGGGGSALTSGGGGASSLAPAPASPSNVTVNVSALDARSFREQMTSPFGSLRRTFADLSSLGAY